MSGNLKLEPSQAAALDLERRRIALKTAVELHDAHDLSGMMATASNLYGWLSLSPRALKRRLQDEPDAAPPALSEARRARA